MLVEIRTEFSAGTGLGNEQICCMTFRACSSGMAVECVPTSQLLYWISTSKSGLPRYAASINFNPLRTSTWLRVLLCLNLFVRVSALKLSSSIL
jgi:hypothetical protein